MIEIIETKNVYSDGSVCATVMSDTSAELTGITSVDGTKLRFGSLAVIAKEDVVCKLASNGVWYKSGISLEDVTITPSTSQQTVTAGEGYDGIGTVTVEAVSLENKTVTPSISQQTITAGANYNGIGTVTVGAVTSAIDSDIVAGNIKKDVTILGVTGTYEGSGGASYKNVLIGLLDGSIETLDIPDGTTFIRSGSCVMLKDLIHVTIPNTVEEIEHNAFAGCTKLETIEIDNYEDEIDDAPWGATNATVTWLR